MATTLSESFIRHINDGQFVGAVGLGIIFRFADAEMQRAFPRQNIREHLPDQQQHDAEMDQGDADFPFARLVVAQVRRQQVDEQHRAEEIAAGKNRNLK